MNSVHFDLERLKAIPFSRVAERLSSIRKSGKHYVTTCPWHQDEHPSLTLYETNGENHCHCFSCGNGGSTIDYVMQRQGLSFTDACELLSGMFGIPAQEGRAQTWNTAINRKGKSPECLSDTKAKPVTQTPEKPVSYIPMDYVNSLVSSENSFCRCLKHLFDAYHVEYLTEQYRLGVYELSDHDDYTIFPSIDAQGRVHNLKVQHYETDPGSPQFFKSDKRHIFWLGPQLARQGVVPQDAVFDNDCLFGAHLLQERPAAMVMLVESPKNAIVGAAACPQHVWVATGNKTALNRKTLLPLSGRQVLVYPDRDAIGEWCQKLSDMNDLAHFQVSDFCEHHAPAEALKFDIADHIISQHINAMSRAGL